MSGSIGKGDENNQNEGIGEDNLSGRKMKGDSDVKGLVQGDVVMVESEVPTVINVDEEESEPYQVDVEMEDEEVEEIENPLKDQDKCKRILNRNL